MSFRKSTVGPIFVHPENLTVRTAEQPTARSENRKYRTLCKRLALKTRHKASRRQAAEGKLCGLAFSLYFTDSYCESFVVCSDEVYQDAPEAILSDGGEFREALE